MFEFVTGKITAFAGTLSVNDAIVTVYPLFLFVIGMIIYAVFVFKFYRFIGGKNVFTPIDKSAKWTRKLLHSLEYVFFYPIIAFFWFLVMSVLLSILSQTVAIGNLFMASMATVVTIRILSYYSEELSREVAKLVPLALLGLMLLDITRISISAPFTVIMNLPASAHTLFYYFVFLVVAEFGLRLLYFVGRKK
ncbi:MAG TPA: hypothetical protein VJI12_00225 [archaeon]|nr:hypothetical protein [archaeon]